MSRLISYLHKKQFHPSLSLLCTNVLEPAIEQMYSYLSMPLERRGLRTIRIRIRTPIF